MSSEFEKAFNELKETLSGSEISKKKFNDAIAQLRSELISNNDNRSNDSTLSGRLIVSTVIKFNICLLWWRSMLRIF